MIKKMMEQYFADFWKEFNLIHTKAKEYFILAEEYDENLDTFIQPIKEHKDALDHIVRAYSKYNGNANNELNETAVRYIKENLSKAKGHIYRAFYDCSDILSIVLRKKISDGLKDFKFDEIVSVWKDYSEIRERLILIPNKFKDLRLKKDVADIKEEILTEYQKEISWLFDVYGTLYIKIVPKLYANRKKQ